MAWNTELLRRAATGVAALLLAGCTPAERLTNFEMGPPPDRVLGFAWETLATDVAGDGQRADSADGKSFAFYYDAEADELWFRFELHGPVYPDFPAVSVAIDTDVDQETGVQWYGSNSTFVLDTILSVGPLERVAGGVHGYNGITDAIGVRSQDWINVAQGVLAFHVDPDTQAYFVGVATTDLALAELHLRVIGSVGADARWNDDIGESGYATIDLREAPWARLPSVEKAAVEPLPQEVEDHPRAAAFGVGYGEPA